MQVNYRHYSIFQLPFVCGLYHKTARISTSPRKKSRGHRWNDDIDLWRGYDWEDYGREMLDCCGYQIPDHILDFIDLERYGKYCGEETLSEYSDGLIEIQ